MEESLKLKEYTDKLDKVMKYNDGDMTRAKQIVQGVLKDFVVIKGKMVSEQNSQSGLFLLFIHKFKYYLVDKVSVIKDNQSFTATVAINDSWRSYFVEIEAALTQQEYLKDKVTRLNQEWEKEFRPAILSQMLEKLQNKDLTSVTIQLEKICSYAFGKGDFFLQMDFEEIPSYEYEDVVKASFSQMEENKREQEKPSENKAAQEETSDEVELFRRKLASEGNILIKGETSLSPVKGRFISEIHPGDIINGRIKDASSKAVNVIRQLNLMTPEGRVKKTKGKVLFAKKNEKGFVLLLQIAPLVVLEIIEEEEVKVECFTGNEALAKKKKSSAMPLIIISSIITAVVVLASIILIAF